MMKREIRRCLNCDSLITLLGDNPSGTHPYCLCGAGPMTTIPTPNELAVMAGAGNTCAQYIIAPRIEPDPIIPGPPR